MEVVNTHVYGGFMDSPLSKDRLTPKDWIAHGLRTAARQGADALKVGPLAAGLNVSRGSFYWHFRDLADFRGQLLKVWQERATDQIIRNIDAAIVGPARLTYLMKLAFNEDRSLDRAIRAWAATDATVALAVAAVDDRRISYIAKILCESDVESRKAQPRAEFIYWAYIGQSGIVNPEHTAITEADLDDLSGLFTR